MTAPRLLVAGVGNVFLGDDGFGVEVANALLREPPEAATIVDFGIRGLHLAYALLEGCDLLIAIDAMPRGGEPGTLYVLEPEETYALPPVQAEGHGMSLPVVFAMVRQLGGTLPPVRVVGCEPAFVGERLGLGVEVAAAVPRAADVVRRLITNALAEQAYRHVG